MSDDRLTPEERAVIDAALHTYGHATTGPILRDAVMAYYASTLRPVEVLMSRWPDERPETGGWSATYRDVDEFGPQGQEVWWVTITPIERVR